jgi:phosphate transport system substrate-binding protein
MRHANRAIAILALTLVTSCSNQTLPAATPPSTLTPLRLYATDAALPLLQDLVLAYANVSPTIVFDTQSADYASLVEQVLAGELPYFVTNYVPYDTNLWAAPLAQDGISVVVHPNNPINTLSLAQLREIYAGTINNWQTLGGSNLPITVFSTQSTDSTRLELDAQVFGTMSITPNALIVPNHSAMSSGVAGAEGGIGYLTLGYINPTVKSVNIEGQPFSASAISTNAYPLRSIIYIVGQREPVTDYRAFIGWVQSSSGQAVVSQRFAPLP